MDLLDSRSQVRHANTRVYKFDSEITYGMTRTGGAVRGNAHRDQKVEKPDNLTAAKSGCRYLLVPSAGTPRFNSDP